MLEILNTVCSLFKKQEVVVDTISNQLVSRYLFMCLISCSAVSQLRQFSSEHMSCVTARESFQPVINSYCSTLGTFTYPPPLDERLWAVNVVVNNKKTTRTRSAWCEAYPGVYPYKDDEPTRIYNRCSMSLPIYFFHMAATCPICQFWWEKKERKLMAHFVQQLNQPAVDEEREDKQVETSARHFNGSIKEHRRYALDYLLLHVFNIALLLLHLYLLFIVVDTDYIFYGYEAFTYFDVPPEGRPHGLARRFTLVAKCEFRHWSQTMELYIDHAICIIHLNKVYQLLLAIYWWKLCLALMGNLVAVSSHAMKIMFPVIRRIELQYILRTAAHSEERKAIDKLNFGSGFVVFMMCKNLEYHIVKKILKEVSSYPDCSSSNNMKMKKITE